jgi:hypothetical protein
MKAGDKVDWPDDVWMADCTSNLALSPVASVDEGVTDFTVYSCVEHRCKLVATHVHAKRLYLAWRNPAKVPVPPFVPFGPAK